jgi:RNA polymerase subunit RPABC4/transcription elongation factor Spt4
MTCSSCGYMMGPFDKNCPRCQNLPRTAPPPPQTPVPQIPLSEPVQATTPALPATMMLCPACGKSMSRKARACPQCGESFEPPTEKKVFHIILIVWATINTLCALGVTIGGMATVAQSTSSDVPKVYAIVLIVAWSWAAMWWAIARWYGRRSQPKR